jgi:hypothetical protein
VGRSIWCCARNEHRYYGNRYTELFSSPFYSREVTLSDQLLLLAHDRVRDSFGSRCNEHYFSYAEAMLPE